MQSTEGHAVGTKPVVPNSWPLMPLFSALSWQDTGPFSDMRALRMMLVMTSGAIWAQWIFTPLAGVPSTAKSWYHHKVSVGQEGSPYTWALVYA